MVIDWTFGMIFAMNIIVYHSEFGMVFDCAIYIPEIVLIMAHGLRLKKI